LLVIVADGYIICAPIWHFSVLFYWFKEKFNPMRNGMRASQPTPDGPA